jgi:cell division protein FtsL
MERENTMTQINVLWLLLIVPVSVICGVLLTVLYVKAQMKQIDEEVKKLKELVRKAKKSLYKTKKNLEESGEKQEKTAQNHGENKATVWK